MGRLVTFIFLVLISSQSHALTIICEKAESQEQRVEWLNKSFHSSQIVVLLGKPIPTESATTKHKVLRVWKGAVGEYVFVYGGEESGLLFTSRINNVGPLKSVQSHCDYLSNYNSEISALDLLKQNHGNGYLPDLSIKEPQYAQTYLDWFFMFGFVFLVIISMITYSFVQYKTNK